MPRVDHLRFGGQLFIITKLRQGVPEHESAPSQGKHEGNAYDCHAFVVDPAQSLRHCESVRLKENSDSADLGDTAFHHYLPVPEELFKADVYLTCGGRMVIPPGSPYPPVPYPALYQFNWGGGRVLPEFSLILITAGSGMFESKETGLIKVDAGMGFFLFPGIWHRYRPSPLAGWTEKWMNFNGAFPHQLLAQGALSPKRPVFCHPAPQVLSDGMDRLLDRIHRDQFSNTRQISFHTTSVLTLALSDLESDRPQETAKAHLAKYDPTVMAALDYIWTRSHSVLSVKDVAGAIGVTRRTLERRISAALGHSVLDEIIHCRFSRAERLLSETELPIKAIVTLAGFGSAENLRLIFQERTQLSPSEYRQRHRSGRGK